MRARRSSEWAALLRPRWAESSVCMAWSRPISLRTKLDQAVGGGRRRPAPRMRSMSATKPSTLATSFVLHAGRPGAAARRRRAARPSTRSPWATGCGPGRRAARSMSAPPRPFVRVASRSHDSAAATPVRSRKRAPSRLSTGMPASCSATCTGASRVLTRASTTMSAAGDPGGDAARRCGPTVAVDGLGRARRCAGASGRRRRAGRAGSALATRRAVVRQQVRRGGHDRRPGSGS